MPTISVRRVGEELAKLYKAEGWAGKEVRIASIEDRKADTCMQRNKGAEEAFLEGGARISSRRTSFASPMTTRWSTPSTS